MSAAHADLNVMKGQLGWIRDPGILTAAITVVQSPRTVLRFATAIRKAFSTKIVARVASIAQPTISSVGMHLRTAISLTTGAIHRPAFGQ